MSEYLWLLRRRPAYRALWIAEVISQTGDWFSFVAVSIVSARGAEGGGALALATVLCAHLLPQALLSPVAGLLADRWDRRTILVVGNVLEGLLTLAMVATAMRGSIGALQVLLLARASVSAMREPAAGAALPKLVSQGELGAANAFGAATWSTTFVAGMALGGLATELGPAVALAVDAATFFVAAVVLAALPRLVPTRTDEPLDRDRAQSSSVRLAAALWRDLAVAVRRLGSPAIRAAVLGKTPAAIAAGAAWLALNLEAQRAPFIGGAASTLGMLQAVRGIGTGLGPLAARALVRRGIRPTAVAHGAAIALACGALALASSNGPVVALAAALAWGAGGGALWVITMTEIQERSEDGVRGRMLALDTLGFTVGMSGSALLAAFAAERGVALSAVAGVVVAVAAAGWIAIRGGRIPSEDAASATA